jgi:hypothetical protein
VATALRAAQGPAAAFGGALRAALIRARAAVRWQLCDDEVSDFLVATRNLYWALILT